MSCYTIVRCAFAITALQFVNAETVYETNKEILSKIAAENINRFGSVSSIEYSGLQTTTFTSPIPFGSGVFKEQTNSVAFSYSRGNFSFVQKTESTPEGPSSHFKVCFDQDLWQYFDYVSQRLIVSKAVQQIGVARGSNLLFLPFTNFIFPNAGNSQLSLLDILSDYGSLGLWQAALSNIVKVQQGSVTLPGDSVEVTSVFASPIAGDPPGTLVTTFSVADDMFPIKWTLSFGKTIAEYSVSQLHELAVSGSPLKLRIPKQAKIRNYENGVESQHTLIEITEVKINQAVSDENFTIDPSQATDINDLDEDIVIPVPK